MRVRKFGMAVVALVAATGVTLTASASADAPNTLYVGVTNCSDTGSGTMAAPFCTVTAAVAAVVPGDTIILSAGAHNEAVVINKSGTPTAPITISASLGSIGGPASGLTIDGVHDVVVSNIQMNQTPSGIVVRNSSHITMNGLRVSVLASATVPAVSLIGTTDSTITTLSLSAPAGGISLDPATSGISITTPSVINTLSLTRPSVGIDVFGSDNKIVDGNIPKHNGPAIRLETSAQANIVADNTIPPSGGDGIDDNGIGNDIVNNTVWGSCNVGINIGPTATNSSVENNVVNADSSCGADTTTEHVGIGVFGAATASATVDYNTVDATAPSLPYAWTTDRMSLAAFQQASGQGAHDNTGPLDTDGSVMPTYLSPMTDSANTAAPGYQPTDSHGHTPADNPLDPNTGSGPVTYADRGALELQQSQPVPAANYAPQTILTGDPAPSWQVTETPFANTDWEPVTSFTVDFGDGTPATTLPPAATSTAAESTATFTHVYHGAQAERIAITDVDADGVTASTSINTFLTAPQVIFVSNSSTFSDDLAAGTPVTVDANSAAGWLGPYTYTFNFGDGTGWVAADPSNPAAATHTYQKAGTYEVTTIESGDDNGISYTSGPSTADVTNGPGRYTPIAPIRVLDTRNATGVKTTTPLAGGHTLTLPVSGLNGVPANAIAVALNLTATHGTSSGWLTAYADGTPRPTASDLNWTAGSSVPNFVVVPVANGKIDLYNAGTGSVHLIADLAGYYGLTGDDFTTYGPSRVLDTRTGTGVAHAVAVQPGQTIHLPLTTALASVTSPDAATFNVTVTQPSRPGYLIVYPDGTTRPTVSNLNWMPGQTIANTVTVANSNGVVDFYNASSGTIQLIVDAFGVYRSGVTDTAYTPEVPNRVLDTRNRIGVSTTKPIGPHQSITFLVDDTDRIFLFNVTVTGGTSSGYLRLGAPGSPSTTSNLNWAAGQTIANTAVVDAGSGNAVTVYNGSSGTVQVIVDELGMFAPDVAP